MDRRGGAGVQSIRSTISTCTVMMYSSILAINLASSLTIETISKNNGGGGNHGGQGTIKTITNNKKEAKQ